MSEHIIESFDYLNVTVDEKLCSQYMDGYQKFGWKQDDNMHPEKSMGKVTLHMKRSRHIINTVELTRLQQHYEWRRLLRWRLLKIQFRQRCP